MTETQRTELEQSPLSSAEFSSVLGRMSPQDACERMALFAARMERLWRLSLANAERLIGLVEKEQEEMRRMLDTQVALRELLQTAMHDEGRASSEHIPG